jgi:hypothetical protein
MSSLKENPVFRFFEKRGEKDIVCLVPDCKKTRRTSYLSGNLRAHLKAKHKEQFQLVERLSSNNDNSDNYEEKRNVASNSSLAPKRKNLEAACSSIFLEPQKKKRRLSMEITEKQVVASCVEMVTVNGRL